MKRAFSDKHVPASLKRKEGMALAVITVLWLVLNTSLFGKELKAVGKIPANLSMTIEEKKLAVDGPVYIFASELTSKTPSDASVLFLYENITRFRKAVYYTYPRRITPVNDLKDLNDADMLKNDFVAVYLNEGGVNSVGATSETLHKLDRNPLLKKISGADNWAIYTVRKARA